MRYMENWKDISGYEGYYQVSDKGNIRNVRTNNNLKHTMNNRGYEQVTLSKDGKKKTIRVHKLVADAFLPNPNEIDIAIHIDGDRTNNAVINLKWINQNNDTVTEDPVIESKKKTLKDRLKRFFKCIILFFYY